MPIDEKLLATISVSDSPLAGLAEALNQFSESESAGVLEEHRRNDLKEKELAAKKEEVRELHRKNQLATLHLEELKVQTQLIHELYELIKEHTSEHFEEHHQPLYRFLQKIDGRVWVVLQALNLLSSIVIEKGHLPSESLALLDALKILSRDQEAGVPANLIFNVGSEQTNLSASRDVTGTKISEGE